MTEIKGNIVGQRVDVPDRDIEDLRTGPARITPKRALHVNLRENDGTELTAFPVSGSVSITGTVTVDTEFSTGTEIVDGERRPRCPQVAAFAMGYNEDDEEWNRSRHGTVHNLHTGDYEPNTGVSLRLEGASGSVPVGDSDPLPVSIPTTKEITNYDNTTSVPDIYIGWAAIGSADSGSVWRIQKWDYTGTNYTIRWADAGSQTNIWNSRASLTYT